MKKKSRSRKHDDIELASLRLSLIKEYSKYRDFFAKNRDRIHDAYQNWGTAIRENRVPFLIPFVNRFGEEISLEDGLTGSPKTSFLPVENILTWFHRTLEEDFGIINPPFKFSMSTIDGEHEGLTPEESLDLLDPLKDIESVTKEKRDAALRFMFTTYGVRMIIQDDQNREGFPEPATMTVFELEQRRIQHTLLFQLEGKVKNPFWYKGKLNPFFLSGLLQSERILVVDLRSKKSKLLSEFKAFVDGVKQHRKQTTDPEWSKIYSTWKLDTTRTRAEAWRHLKVWKLRRQRKAFSEIAILVGMKNSDTAKKSFYKAAELIQGRRYKRNEFRRDYWEIKKEELKRTCSTCPEHPSKGGTCNVLCPDVLPYVDQDYQARQEKLISPQHSERNCSSDPGPTRSTPRRKNK